MGAGVGGAGGAAGKRAVSPGTTGGESGGV